MGINCPTVEVEVLKKLFPDGLVGKEIGYKHLSPPLTVKEAYKYIEKMTIKYFVNQDAPLKLLQSSYEVKYTPSPKGCTVSVQLLKHIQYQLKDIHTDKSVQ